jgi:hypothetical protein
MVKFLILGEMAMKENSCHTAVLHIVFPSPSRLLTLSEAYSEESDTSVLADFFTRRVDGILTPLANLFSFISKVLLHRKRSNCLIDGGKHVFPKGYRVLKPIAAYSLNQVVGLINKGEVPFSIMLPSATKNLPTLSSKTLTITLRHTKYQTSRNSNLTGWSCFAEARLNDGFDVVWLLDMEDESPSSTLDLPGVVLNNNCIVVRSWVYQNSLANFFVNSGLAALGRFNHLAVTASFKLLDESIASTSSKFWLSKGIKPGQQFDFLSPLHFQCWKPDSFGHIENVWNDHIKSKTLWSKQRKLEAVNKWKLGIQARKIFTLVDSNKVDMSLETYIWGVSESSCEIKKRLLQRNISIVAFVDSFKFDTEFCGVSVLHPSQLDRDKNKNIVLIPHSKSGQIKYKALQTFIRNHFNQNANLIDFRHL